PSTGASAPGPAASSCTTPDASAASQRRPASPPESDEPPASSTAPANPKASMTAPVSARQSQVRRAMSGCGTPRGRDPPPSAPPSLLRAAPSSASSRSAPDDALAASISQESAEGSCMSGHAAESGVVSSRHLEVLCPRRLMLSYGRDSSKEPRDG